MSQIMRWSGAVAWLLVLAAILLGGRVSPAATPVVVYSALENDEIAEYLKVARQELPDLDIRVLRLSTGELAARVLAEKGNLQADLLWGVAATATLPLVREGVLEPYVPKGSYKILRQFRDPKGYWTGIGLYVGAVAVNTVELSKRAYRCPARGPTWPTPSIRGS